MSLGKALPELIMEKVLEVLKADEVLSAEVRAFRLSEPMSLVELPLIYVELSPSSGEQLIPRGSATFERLIRLDICVVDRHVDPERADIHVLRLAERVCCCLARDPRLGGLVEDSLVERVVPEYGALRDHAISRARITLACRVMWRAEP